MKLRKNSLNHGRTSYQEDLPSSGRSYWRGNEFSVTRGDVEEAVELTVSEKVTHHQSDPLL